MPSPLELSILRTLAYFAYFQYPLSSFEIWKWLFNPPPGTSFGDLAVTLATSPVLKKYAPSAHGFYALANSAEVVEVQVRERRRRLHDAVRKERKARRVAGLIGRLPWVYGVAICNSLAWRHTTNESDIDFFVVAEPGRVWTTRLLATIPLILLKQRPGEAKQDPICLSFFAAHSALAMERLKIAKEDPYLAAWCASLIPLIDATGWHAALTRENAWVKHLWPNARPVIAAPRFRLNSFWRLPRLALSETFARALQYERFPAPIKKLMNQDTRVVVTNDILKFHENDRRQEIVDSMYEANFV